MTDIFSKEKRSQIMKLVKSSGTNIEMILRKELFKKGYRFRVKTNVFGRPDIVFINKKVAIFCDGDFWHGKNFKKEKIGYRDFWKKKIQLNIERDKLVTKTLIKEGWSVLRFWKSEILKDTDRCIVRVEKELQRSNEKVTDKKRRNG